MSKIKLDIQPTNVVENKGGQFRTVRGRSAIGAFVLRTLLLGLRTEQRTGGKVRLTRGPSCRARAKRLLGVRTNDYARLIELVEARMQQELAAVVIVDRDEELPSDYDDTTKP